MRINIIATALMMLAFTQAAEARDPHDHQHGSETYHAFTLETDYGAGEHGPVARWDFDGWIGTDESKLWLKSEGENSDGRTEQSEFWAMYSRNVSTFWDAQTGIRHDTQPRSTSYAVLGVNGLAPFHIETVAHVFISDDGDVSARLHPHTELLVTQRLILEPYAEINLFAQDVPELETGVGFSDAEIGLQTRYEITRKFAPYVDMRYERKFGQTANITKSNGEDDDSFIAALGLRLMF